MRILLYLHHPSQFHMFKFVVPDLRQRHDLKIVATTKDVLVDLLENEGWPYTNMLPKGRKNNKLSIALGLLKQDLRLFAICREFKPQLLIGTSTEIAHIGALLSIPSFFFVEDDASVIPLAAWLAYPFVSRIVSPRPCNNGRWQTKTIAYEGYQKLAYLHPNYFTADPAIAGKYMNLNERNFLIRLSKLSAHHDSKASGVSKNLLKELIKTLAPLGRVHISSEAELPEELASYRLKVVPSDLHHLLAHMNFYVGDSQSMAVEAALLGIPGIRISSFEGKISVLEELEKEFRLTFAFQPLNTAAILQKTRELTEGREVLSVFSERRQRMLSVKTDVSRFFIRLVEHYKDYLP